MRPHARVWILPGSSRLRSRTAANPNGAICAEPPTLVVQEAGVPIRRSRAGRGCRQLRSVILLRAVSVRTGIYIGIRRVRGGETSTAGPESLSRRTRPVSALLSRAQ